MTLIGQKLKSYRKVSGLTCGKMAEMINPKNVNDIRARLRDYESGRIIPKVGEWLKRLSEILGEDLVPVVLADRAERDAKKNEKVSNLSVCPVCGNQAINRIGSLENCISENCRHWREV